MHRAGAALAAVASNFGAGESETIAKQLDQRPPVLHFHLMRDTVDGEVDRRSRHGRTR